MPLNLLNNHLTLIKKHHFQSIIIALTFRQTYITMILRLSGLFIGVCMFAQLQAQDNQYIVKFNGDTIRGKLQLNLSGDNSMTMLFKAEGGKKEQIRPIRVKYVHYDEEYQFRSVPFYNQRLFMQIIKEDRHISYYNYIHKRNNSMMATKVVLKPNGEAIELSGITFRKQVTEFLDDCPEIVARLEAKKYRYKDHKQLFADYNDCDQKLVISNSAPAIPDEPGQPEKLAKIDEFSNYLSGLTDFENSKDVSEWLSLKSGLIKIVKFPITYGIH